MEKVLFKGQRMDGKGSAIGCHVFSIDEGNLIFEIKHSSGNQDEPPHEWQRSYRINPETLCQFTGLNAEWFNEGIDPRIWSGDLFEAEDYYRKGKINKWQVIYEKGAFYVKKGKESLLLYHFLNSYAYTKIGSIHDQK